MAGSKAVTLTFAGDTTSLNKSLSAANTDLDGFSSHASKADQSFTDSAGKITKTSKGVKDSVKGLTDGLAALGVSFPGEQAVMFAGVAMDLSRGAKDLAEGLGDGVSSALQKMRGMLGLSTAATEAQTAATEEGTVAQDELNTSLLANPIGLIIAAAAVLAVGFYELWEHSETFRNAVKKLGTDALAVFQAIWGGVKTAMSAITGAVGGVITFIKDHWKLLTDIFLGPIGILITNFGAVKSVVSGVAGAVKSAFEGAFNFVADAWNATVGQLSFHIPGWVPGIGGDGFSVPQMHHFANGGRSNGGLAMVGERGPEVVDLPMGAMVTANGRGGTGGGGSTHVTVDFSGVSNDALVNALRQAVRVRGGNVQTAIGVGY